MVKRKTIRAKKTKRVKKDAKATKAPKAKKAVSGKKTKLTKSKVCCTKCGDCKGVSKDRMAKLIGQFGSIEELHDNYVCRSCRKEHNVRADGKMKPEKRKRRNKSVLKKDANGVSILPKWMEDISTAFGWGGGPDFGPEHCYKLGKPLPKKD